MGHMEIFSERMASALIRVTAAVLIAAPVTVSVVPTSSAADERALIGAAIAAERCGRCHAVGLADSSPHKITPPLRRLIDRFPVEMLQEALRTGSISGHDEMPQFDLGVDGVEAVLAYIDSLNPQGPRYLEKKR